MLVRLGLYPRMAVKWCFVVDFLGKDSLGKDSFSNLYLSSAKKIGRSRSLALTQEKLYSNCKRSCVLCSLWAWLPLMHQAWRVQTPVEHQITLIHGPIQVRADQLRWRRQPAKVGSERSAG